MCACKYIEWNIFFFTFVISLWCTCFPVFISVSSFIIQTNNDRITKPQYCSTGIFAIPDASATYRWRHHRHSAENLSSCLHRVHITPLIRTHVHLSRMSVHCGYTRPDMSPSWLQQCNRQHTTAPTTRRPDELHNYLHYKSEPTKWRSSTSLTDTKTYYINGAPHP